MIHKKCSACGCVLSSDKEQHIGMCILCKAEKESLHYYLEGKQAFQDGQVLLCAPYPARSFAWHWWRNGWLDAYSNYLDKLLWEEQP